jgi:hypothetical protein
MHLNPETGDIGGAEVFIVRSLKRVAAEYFALVQLAFSKPDVSPGSPSPRGTLTRSGSGESRSTRTPHAEVIASGVEEVGAG